MPENESPLLSLAPELIQVITDDLTTDIIKDLRLTCKQLSECLSLRLFHNLTISLSQVTFEKEVSKVRILATTDHHAASSGARMLKIGSLSPGYDPEHRTLPTWKHVDGLLVPEHPEDPPDVLAAEKELKGYLFKAIASLRGIQSVEWEAFHKDGDWAQEAVMKALKTLPNLRVLHLHSTYFKIAVPLHKLSGIQEISVSGIDNNSHAKILDNVAKLVARSPMIMSIEILNDWTYCKPLGKTQSLHNIFKYYPQNSTPLQLRHLSLKTTLIKLDDLTLPHLQHLTSLSLTNIADPYNMEYQGPSDSRHVKEQKKYGSTRDDIWKALKISRIKLEELALDFVVTSFLEYLSSYSGLKKLQLKPGGFHNGSSSDSLARQFFSTSLTHHIHNLEELRVIPSYEGSWCFGRHNETIISRCTNLKVIQMAIVSLHLRPFGSLENLESGTDRNVVEHFIDVTSNFMPRLECLIISAADLEQFWWASCGSPAMRHFHLTAREITLKVQEYRPLPTCHRLPQLTVRVGSGSERTFVPGEPDEDGQLHYK